MNLHLENKVVIVSGGARGIGEGITRILAEEGAFPVIIGRDETDNQKLVEELMNMGLKAAFVTAELTEPNACKEAVEKVIAAYGTIHCVVNNAGVNDNVGLQYGSYAGFISSYQKNVVHYYLLVQHALPELIKNKGSIVNISSKVSETGQGDTSGYAAANGARNALTREWAVELLKYNIRVNAVIVAECYTPLYEQWVNTFDRPEKKMESITEKIPLGKRMTTAHEIGSTVAFLLSVKSSHTTGQLVYVDGGYVHLDRAL